MTGPWSPLATSSTRSMRSSPTSRALRGFRPKRFARTRAILKLTGDGARGRASTRSNRISTTFEDILPISTVHRMRRAPSRLIYLPCGRYFDGPMQKASWKLMSPRWCRCQRCRVLSPKRCPPPRCSGFWPLPTRQPPLACAMPRCSSCSTQRARVSQSCRTSISRTSIGRPRRFASSERARRSASFPSIAVPSMRPVPISMTLGPFWCEPQAIQRQ